MWGKLVWDNRSQVSAPVLDLDRTEAVREMRSDAADQSSLGVYIWVQG